VVLIGVGGFFALTVGAVLVVGRGDAKVRAPEYPGAFSVQRNPGKNATFTFKTKDSADKVAKFYRDKFQSSGLDVDDGMWQIGVLQSRFVTAQDTTRRHVVMVVAANGNNETSVNITYSSK
jgi:hypothetical protein